MAPDSRTDAPGDERSTAAADADGPDAQETWPVPPERPIFQHPQWMLGVVLILGVAAVVAGLSNPVWWLIGSPFILVLAIYAWVRIRTS